MTRAQAKAPRGAAVVETALGVMVSVTVLLFGVHFSEVLWISMKAQEASTSAKWDATAMRAHQLPGDYSYARAIPAAVAQTSKSRYTDFDGRTSANGRSTLSLAATAAGNLNVACDLAGGVQFPRAALPARLTGVFQDVGGLRCTASADTWLTRIPQTFGEGPGGLFAARHVFGAQRYHACGFGRPFASTCPAGPPLLIGDWGLEGEDDGVECFLSSGWKCPNQGYYRSTELVYNAGGKAKGVAAMAFAGAVVGTVPVDINQFWFSFRGEESAFIECTPETMGEGPNKWVTNPGLGSPVRQYEESYLKRGECALGLPKDGQSGMCPDHVW